MTDEDLNFLLVLKKKDLQKLVARIRGTYRSGASILSGIVEP
jgi:hypothetical protein